MIVRDATKLKCFNIRRFARWVKNHFVKIPKESISWLQKNFGELGELDPKIHAA
jgi:hypothetical protein